MLARLQQILVFSLALAAVAGFSLAVALGLSWGGALLVAMALLLGHAWVLAIEFALLRRVDPGAGIPRPSLRQLLRAWWGEIWTGARVFGWRQPFRSRQHPDHLDPATAPGRRGVVLVHGFVCNRGLWNPWMARLRAAGVPHVAVNLEPVFGPIDRYPPIVERAVRAVEEATGRPPLIVAHSMGGLAVRAWLRDHRAGRRVHGVVTVGAPHHGTWLARFGLTANTRQMSRFSEWLAQLARDETSHPRPAFTCFYGHCDNIVFPASTSMLPGADNRHLPGVAHVHLLFQPAVWNEVCRQLDEAGASDA